MSGSLGTKVDVSGSSRLVAGEVVFDSTLWSSGLIPLPLLSSLLGSLLGGSDVPQASKRTHRSAL